MRFILICLVLLPLTAFSWDAAGHRLIAAIAYNHLTATTKQSVDYLTTKLSKSHSSSSRFMYVATLPDKWRGNEKSGFASWHYMDTPWSMDGTATQPATSPDLILGMEKNEDILKNADSSIRQKAIALSWIVHLVGDAHQPMHCINLFRDMFSKGDKGGNLFPIKARYASNLHSFWDQGLRLLMPPKNHYPPAHKTIIRFSRQIQVDYPEYSADISSNAVDWSQHCFELGKLAYKIKPHERPSTEYIDFAKETVMKQFALAGYRLAHILNSWTISLD